MYKNVLLTPHLRLYTANVFCDVIQNRKGEVHSIHVVKSRILFIACFIELFATNWHPTFELMRERSSPGVLKILYKLEIFNFIENF